jgi:hypothetical protein
MNALMAVIKKDDNREPPMLLAVLLFSKCFHLMKTSMSKLCWGINLTKGYEWKRRRATTKNAREKQKKLVLS